MFEDEEEDKQILKQLRKRKPSFSDVVNKRKLDKFELDSVLSGDF